MNKKPNLRLIPGGKKETDWIEIGCWIILVLSSLVLLLIAFHLIK